MNEYVKRTIRSNATIRSNMKKQPTLAVMRRINEREATAQKNEQKEDSVSEFPPSPTISM